LWPSSGHTPTGTCPAYAGSPRAECSTPSGVSSGVYHSIISIITAEIYTNVFNYLMTY